MRVARYDDPDSLALIDEVQLEYVERYGGPDEAPIDPDEFAPPRGLFIIGYLDGIPVATGGWRKPLVNNGLRDGDVEIKRMFVVTSARGRGLSRLMLAELERTATAAGARRMVLETGDKQPEAISLYTSSGYSGISPFGYYADHELARHFGKSLV